MKTLGREARTLVDAARAAAPLAADRERIRHKLHARLGIGIAAGAAAALAPKSAAAATAGATKAIGAGLLSSVGVGALIGVMAVGAAWVWDLPGSAPGAGHTPEKAMGAPAQRTASSSASAPSAAPSVPAETAAEVPPSQGEAPPPRRAVEPPPGATAPAPEAPRPASEDTLNVELLLLARAQAALASGEADRALSLLEEHAATYGDGSLREERMAARVFALCAKGRREQAREEARRFVQEAPRSPLAARVRGACAADEGGAPRP